VTVDELARAVAAGDAAAVARLLAPDVVLASDGGGRVAVALADANINRIWLVLNPEKLARWHAVSPGRPSE
jgi:hypothetical protein